MLPAPAGTTAAARVNEPDHVLCGCQTINTPMVMVSISHVHRRTMPTAVNPSVVNACAHPVNIYIRRMCQLLGGFKRGGR